MLFSVEKLAAVLSLTALAAAAPSGNLAARQNQYILPSLVIPINNQTPDTSAGTGTYVQVSSYVFSDPNPILIDTLLRFDNIPSTATLCGLALEMPDDTAYQVGGAPVLDVYTVDRNTTATDTWGNSPQKVKRVSLIDLYPGKGKLAPETILASDLCSSTMSFRLEMNNTLADGYFLFNTTDATNFKIKVLN